VAPIFLIFFRESIDQSVCIFSSRVFVLLCIFLTHPTDLVCPRHWPASMSWLLFWAEVIERCQRWSGVPGQTIALWTSTQREYPSRHLWQRQRVCLSMCVRLFFLSSVFTRDSRNCYSAS